MTPIRTLRPLAKVVLSTQSDERLVALSRQGSEDAFAEIVRRHRPGLLRFARSLGTGDRADDVVQDGLVRAWRALRRSDAEIDLRPWLTTIVRNRALTSHSTNRPTEELDETIDGVRQPGDIVIMREELRSAVSAVNSLPDSQREALVRSALAGESHDQIASALATTPGAVRQLIFRARTGLREAVGAIVPFPLVRALADMGTGTAAAGGSAAGGAAVAASAGGAGMGLKALALVAVGATVAGSGIAIERHTSGADAKETSAATSGGSASGQAGEATTETASYEVTAGDRSAAPEESTGKSDVAVPAETKSSSATRSETLVADAPDGAGTPRVPTASGHSSDSDSSDPNPQTSNPPTQQAPPQQQQQQQVQPHQGGQQQPPPQSGQTTGQYGPPHQGDDQPPPPAPPPPSGETTASDGADYHHPVPTGGGQQPQPTDTHDGNHVGADGLADLTLGD